MKLVCGVSVCGVSVSVLVLLLLLVVQHTAAEDLDLKRTRYWGPYRRLRRSETSSEHCMTQGPGEEEGEMVTGKTSNLIRAITMIIIMVVSMIFGMLPLKTLSMKYRSRIASIANCFGGGVFFGTCFMHLIPEVKLQINGYVEYVERSVRRELGPCQPAPDYLDFLKKLPIPEFLECSGFLLILSVEKIAESAKMLRPLTQRFSVFISTKKLKSAQKLVKKQQLLVKKQQLQDVEAVPDGCVECNHGQESSCVECNSGVTDTESNQGRRKSDQSDVSPTSRRRPLPKTFLAAMKGNLYGKIGSPEEPTAPGQPKKSAAMLILALSIHSFFEGLAIGVEGTEAVFIQLAAAITVHKCVIAFAVGSRLIHSGKSVCGMFWCLFCMCVMTPIGVSLAMIIVSSLDSNTILIVSGTIQGISTGFFLYITFAEMLFQEMRNKQDSFLKVSSMTCGVLLVTASTIWHNWNGAHDHE